MAKKSNRATTTATESGEDIKPDILPDPDDDLEMTADVSDREGDASGHGEERDQEDKKSRPKPFEDARARAAQAYRELRDKEAADSDEDMDEAETLESTAEEQKTAPTSEDNPTPQVTKHKVKIDGNEQELTTEELIAIVQKHGAADNRLEEAKTASAEAKRAAAELRERLAALDSGAQTSTPENQRNGAPGAQDADPSQPSTQGSENQRTNRVDRDKLKAIVERIQVGDTDEGVEAADELIELVSGNRPDLDPSAVREIVQQHLSEQRSQEEITGALRTFKDNYPEVAADPILTQAGMTVLGQELISDMRAVGISDQDIAPIRNNPEALVQAHRQLRGAGHKVRSYGELLDGVGKTMVEKFHLRTSSPTSSQPGTKQPTPARAPSTTAQDRQDRKRSMPQQPRSTGMRDTPPPAAKPKTAQDIIREARKARNFRVAT